MDNPCKLLDFLGKWFKIKVVVLLTYELAVFQSRREISNDPTTLS